MLYHDPPIMLLRFCLTLRYRVGYCKRVSITDWGYAVTKLLSKAAIPQSELADRSGKPRMTVNRYIRGERRPDPEFVLRLNGLTKQIVSGNERIPGNVDIEMYLNVEAALEGLLGAKAFGWAGPFDLSVICGGAMTTLETLGAGMLRADWAERFIEAVQRQIPEKQVTRLLVELNRVHGRLLLDAIGGRVPVATGYEAVRAVLTKYALSGLLKDDTEPADAFERLITEIRQAVTEIAGPDVTAIERFEAERKLFRIACTFAVGTHKNFREVYDLINESFGAAQNASRLRKKEMKWQIPD